MRVGRQEKNNNTQAMYVGRSCQPPQNSKRTAICLVLGFGYEVDHHSNITLAQSIESYGLRGSILQDVCHTAPHALTMPTGGVSLSQMNMILVTRGSPFMSLQGVPPPITTS